MKIEPLTTEQKAVNHETWTHILNVQRLLADVQIELGERMLAHDQTKLGPPEVAIFTEVTPKLKDMEYGSEEYKECLAGMKPALDHHYANNRHHPEFHKDGVNDMTLVDLIEMICDWTASSKRNKSGDVRKGLPYNKERFGLSDQLYKILCNTVEAIDPK